MSDDSPLRDREAPPLFTTRTFAPWYAKARGFKSAVSRVDLKRESRKRKSMPTRDKLWPSPGGFCASALSGRRGLGYQVDAPRFGGKMIESSEKALAQKPPGEGQSLSRVGMDLRFLLYL